MKKILSILVLAAVALSATACSSSQKKSDSVSTQVQTSTAEASAVSNSEDMPTVLDFSATWCPPCRQMKPVFQALEKEYEGRVKFVTVDIDENPGLAQEYGIEAVPTFIFLDESGREVNRIVGGQQKATLVEAIEELL